MDGRHLEIRRSQWRSQVFESRSSTRGSGKTDLPKAFYERRTREFGGESGPFPGKKLNLGLEEMQFPAVLRGLIAFFNLFLVDLLSCSLHTNITKITDAFSSESRTRMWDFLYCWIAKTIPPPPPPPQPHYLYANLNKFSLWDPYFQKVGKYVPHPQWLHQWL